MAQVVSYSNDRAGRTEATLDVRADGVVLWLPPQPRWLSASVVGFSILVLIVFVFVDVMALRAGGPVQRSLVTGREHWLELVFLAVGLFVSLAMKFVAVAALVSAVMRMTGKPPRLEAAAGRLACVTPRLRGERRKEWPPGGVAWLRVDRSAKPDLAGRYAFQLQTSPGFRLTFFNRRPEFGDEVAAAFPRALGLKDDDEHLAKRE